MASLSNVIIGILVLACLSTSFCFLIPDGIQKVTTKYGEIIGFTEDVSFENHMYQVRKFLGIPYAEPPIGNLRFKKPIMKKSLPSPFKAQQFGPSCPQLNRSNSTMSENCLFLNIYTPSTMDTGMVSKPVMIWVHGGGFILGSSDRYGGEVLSALNDVIVVTLNYRLGALGFFSTHDNNAKGNYGLWDQHLAFRWVYENIGDFGGDNANMTIFGESAGSSSVVYQMLYPGNEGVFKRVIAESGTIAAWGIGNGNANYESSMSFGQLAGCNETNHSQLVQCLQQQKESVIVSAAEQAVEGTYNEVNVSWVPVFDHEFVPAKTNTILNELADDGNRKKYNSFRSFDLLIGANNYDGLVYVSSLLPYLSHSDTASKYLAFGEHLNDFVIPRSIQSWLGETPTPLALKLTEGEYTSWADPTNITLRMISAAKLYTDYAFNAPMIKTASAHGNTLASTYVYQFSNANPIQFIETPVEIANDYVANHGDEIAFVFGFPGVSRERLALDDTKLSKAIMRMWTNFAKSGNPNYPASLQPLYNVTWPEFDGTGENYLEINDKMSPSSVKHRLAARAVEFWNHLLPKVQAFAKSSS